MHASHTRTRIPIIDHRTGKRIEGSPFESSCEESSAASWRATRFRSHEELGVRIELLELGEARRGVLRIPVLHARVRLDVRQELEGVRRAAQGALELLGRLAGSGRVLDDAAQVRE